MPPILPSPFNEELEREKLRLRTNPRMPGLPGASERLSILEAFELLQNLSFQISAANGFWDDPEELITVRKWLQAEEKMPRCIESPELFAALKKLVARDPHNGGEKLALMHSELSEGLEALRKDLPSDKIPFKGIEEELADCMIRIFDYAGKHRLALGEALLTKIVYNATRPYKHGKKF